MIMSQRMVDKSQRYTPYVNRANHTYLSLSHGSKQETGQNNVAHVMSFSVILKQFYFR